MRKYARFKWMPMNMRKIPLPVLIIGIIVVVLCPIALLHFSSTAGNDNLELANVLLNDGQLPVRRYHEENKSWLRNNVPFLLPPPDIQPRVKTSTCPAMKKNPHPPDYYLGNLTMTLTDLKWDGDQGIWDDEMEANYKMIPKNKDEKPLLVYIVPFSHADPGWLSTVEEYFATSTKFALDNMLKKLKEWPDMTFIWAETSYFKMWWETLDESKRRDVKQLTGSGRLEIVNGGWVMPDEATCSYYAILHQYIYGHQWLLDNLGITPEHGFSIDPFGHSSSMPYFLRNYDFKTMFIQRIHYNIRRFLGKNKATEFLWQQPWGESNSMFTHLAPHHLYTIKNICGLTQKNCYFFDFKDIMFDVDQMQIATQAKILLEEIRKTASLYPHNVVLYILGDDFRWAEESEWTNQYRNYKKLIQVINSNPSNNAVIKFGTLKNYYDSVFERTGQPEIPSATLPAIQGDFFPYADKFEAYWTGYFTSRPFYKQMSRELERDLRTAEILLILAKLENPGNYSDFHEDLVGLERAAQHMGLFQHHDAITGTSKRMVALDYGDKLQNGLLMAHAVILKNVFRLAKISSPNRGSVAQKANIILESYRPTATSLPAKSQLIFGVDSNMERMVFVFNPLLRSRTTVIHLFSETPNLVVTDANGVEISYQVSPALNDADSLGNFLPNLVRISFLLQLDPLALKAISIKSLGERWKKIKIKSRLSTTVRTTDLSGDKEKIQGFQVKNLPDAGTLTLSNNFFSALFRTDNGMLQTIQTKNGNRNVEMELKRYETSSSGAYLFIPTGVGDILPYPQTVRVLEGPLFSEVQTITAGIHLTTRIYHTLDDSGKSLELEIITQMDHLTSGLHVQYIPNTELVLRLATDIRNNLTFHTDSNGFQMIERRVSHILPMSANYYPATTFGFLQDNTTRMTLHLTQAHGVGSQRSGELEVMLDRFLQQDDGRGVGEALQDIQAVKTHMNLQIETEGFCADCPYKNPSETASRINFAANTPAYVTIEQVMSNLTKFNYLPVRNSLPCDVHLVMMKPVSYNPGDKRVGFLFHRYGVDCAATSVCMPGKEEVVLDGLLKKAKYLKSYNETSLNFINSRKRHVVKTPVKLQSMNMAAVTAYLP